MLKKIKQLMNVLRISGKDKSERPALNVQERIIKSNLLRLSEKSVGNVMVPRPRIQGIDLEGSLKDAAKLLSYHSRIPVYNKDLDDVKKIIHVKDCLVHFFEKDEHPSLESLGLPPVFVPPSKNLLDMLLEMRRDKRHMAVVVDEYGGTCGLVTMEDILEEIVGEIADEHDTYDPDVAFIKMPGGGVLMDARVEISAFEREFELPPVLSQEVEENTMGGLLVTILGRLPQKNELVKHKGFCFQVAKVTPRSVQKIIVRSVPKTPKAGGERIEPPPKTGHSTQARGLSGN